mmetsp:Transcript_15647/g.34749  ORF Transcript_15647/g.34749 Transcript_15647/m.34749 type:complete len:277 (-) Transcript_15647:40-870(-)
MSKLKSMLPGVGKKSRDPDPGLGGGHTTSVNDFISQTKSRQQQGLKPSGPELIAYARYLGIDPVNDNDLLWLAEEALAAPLPAEWTEHFDSNDRVFYYNATSHVSSWTHPLETIYRDTYKAIVSFRGTKSPQAEKMAQLQTLQQECHELEREVNSEIGAWTEHVDDAGHKFYYNRNHGKSSWTDPRPAQCHLLYLKMKLVRILCQHAGVNMEDAPPRPAEPTEGSSAKRPKVTAETKEVGETPAVKQSPRENGEAATEDSPVKKKKKKKKGQSPNI